MSTSNTRPLSLAESRRARFMQFVAELTLLPTTYAVPMKLLEMKRRSSAGAAEFATVISAEPALAVKVIALANSAAFAPAHPITRLSSAIALVGLNNLLPLVMGLSFAGIFNKLSLPMDEQANVWKASLLKAVTARQVMRMLDRSGESGMCDAAMEEAFLVGLFQDVALPIFYATDRSAWPEFVAVLDLPDAQRQERERRLYGLDHAEAAAICAQKLGLPELFANQLQRHHASAAILSGEARNLALAAHSAAVLPHRLPLLSHKHLHSLLGHLHDAAGLSKDELRELIRMIIDGYTQLSKLFGDPEEASASFKQFLQNLSAEVVDCLQASISHSAVEISGLRERERQIRNELTCLQERAAQAERDPLTRALTRSAFMSRLSKLLALSQDNNIGCAVGFIDVDDFKQVNDKHGHAAGDAALVQLVKSLGAALRGRGIIGRLGGDEFVFALVSRNGNLEQDLAEFRQHASRIVLSHAGQELVLSTSTGIVSIGIPETRDAPERIIKEADVLMYQAKRCGKGRAEVGRLAQAPLIKASR